jgi:capsular polysaccharide transport system ATP-binding protein
MPVRTFSSGMRARLAFGVSLAVDFECYLVDEITAVGDSRFQRRSKAAFKEKLKHANIIMVSHSDSTLRDYCDMGAVLHEGRLTLYDNLVDAISHHKENQQS